MFYSGTIYLHLVYILGLKYWCIFDTVKIPKVGTTFFQNQQSPKKSQKLLKWGKSRFYVKKKLFRREGFPATRTQISICIAAPETQTLQLVLTVSHMQV